MQDDSEEDSEDESEDDEGELVTQELDSEIFATLNAIRSKDPRVYDSKVSFYRPIEEDDDATNGDDTRKEKPVYLRDYHRQNLLNGNVEGDAEEESPPQTYAQEQEAIRNKAVSEMHAAGDEDMKDASDDDDGFLVKKSKSAHDDMPVRAQRKQKQELDVVNADKDPETFLSNFMAARAWMPDGASSRFTALESDDSEEEQRADTFEAAYNMRFEDPKSANEKLQTYGRDLAKLSARREDLSGRKKQREKEREIKEAIKQERRDEKARWRKLRIDEVEQKVKQIKEAAGLGSHDVLDVDEWRNVLDEDFDDAQWEQEMQKRFGDKYYAEHDHLVESDEEETTATKIKSNPKKPKWNDDIDIKDLVPDFADDDEAEKPAFTLSDEDEEQDQDAPMADADADSDEETQAQDPSAARSKKDRARLLSDKKRASRKERRQIESLVDAQLTTSLPTTSSNIGTQAQQQPVAAFRYRETSPTSFGLTARDILFADDSQLNQFAGLKKMAAFRDEEKKSRDRKKLGKKARLRQWRKDTFGNDEGFRGEFADFVRSKGGDEMGGGGEERSGGKRRKGKKRKAEK